jgi:hypothetical protein
LKGSGRAQIKEKLVFTWIAAATISKAAIEIIGGAFFVVPAITKKG